MTVTAITEKELRASLRRSLRKGQIIRINDGNQYFEGRVAAIAPPSFSLRCTHNPGPLGAKLPHPIEAIFHFREITTIRANRRGATATVQH